jgi:hypothetical protein
MQSEYKVICKKCLKELNPQEPICSCGNVAVRYNDLFFAIFVDDIKTITIKQVWYKKIKGHKIIIQERKLPPIHYAKFTENFVFDFEFKNKKAREFFIKNFVDKDKIKETPLKFKKSRANKVKKFLNQIKGE